MIHVDQGTEPTPNTTRAANDNAPSPTLPLQASYTTVMSQDVLMTDTIPVDSTSPSPVGVFTNPTSGGVAGNAQTEALAVVDGQINHVARNPDTDAGWQLVPLFGARAVNEVAAGTAYAASSSANVYGHFSDHDGLYFTELQADGATWSEPVAVPLSSSSSAPPASNMRVAYSPAGRLVLYGSSPQGDLVCAYQPAPGDPFMGVVTPLDGALGQGDFYLCMVDESNWTLAVNQGGQPWLFTGELGVSERSSSGQASGFRGTLKQIVLGYWAAGQNTLMFLFVDADDALHVWAANAASSTTVARPVPNSKVTRAAGHVATDSSLHVYSLDDKQGLWVLHQDPDTPWNDDGTPNWSPYIPLDAGAGGLASDMTPADAPRLFAFDAADYSLRLHSQDANTRMWRTGTVLQAASSAHEVKRFRTEIAVTDANGLPVPNHPITLQVAAGFSAAELWLAAKTYRVDSESPVSVTTDALGKASVAILTTAGLAAPAIVVSADGLTSPVTVHPAGGIHTYLSGQGTLNPTNPGGPLPVFDANGDTLVGAQAQQQPLAPSVQNNPALAATAAQGIRSAAAIAVGQAPGGIAGFHLSLRGPSGPSFTILDNQADVDARVALLRGGAPGSIWGDIDDWAGDVWAGIQNGAIEIQEIAVSAADQVATFTAKIGNEIYHGVQLALHNLEQAAHFVAGIFQAVLADIELVIEWLLALFDFAAIWRTKMAFEQALLAVPVAIKQLSTVGQKAADGWFSKQQQTIDGAFDAVKQSYAGQTFSSLPHWQQPGSGGGSVIAGGATTADFTSNVHHNWLFNKVSSYAPDKSGLTPNTAIQDPWTNFAEQAQAGSTDLLDALRDFYGATQSIVEDPASFGSVAIPDFLGMVEGLTDAVLSFSDAILDAFLGLVDMAMDALETLFSTELDLGFLNTLWSWIAELAGYGNDDKLTVAALLALLAAVPCTVVFKLIAGVDSEPFPDGRLPSTPTGDLLASLPATSEGAALAAAILQMAYFPLALSSDFLGITGAFAGLGDLTPWWLSLAMIGASAIIVALPYLLDLTAVEWASALSVVGALGAIGTMVYIFIETFASDLASSIMQSPTTGDVINIALSVVGVGKLIAGVVETSLEAEAGDVDLLKAGARLLLPLPNVFSYVKLTAFLAWDPVAWAVAVPLKGVADGIGYLGGGALEVADAATHL